MGTQKKTIERRKHRRFRVPEGLYAVLSADGKRVGQVQDISKGGLTFHYIENGKPAQGLVEIDIFSTSGDFSLKKVPSKIITDSRIDKKVPFSSVPMKQVRIQFGEMTPVQTERLDYLLQHYTLVQDPPDKNTAGLKDRTDNIP